MTITADTLAAIPDAHRRTIALWLLQRGSQYQPSLALSPGTAMVLQDAFTGAAVDVSDPHAEDSTTAHAARVVAALRSSTSSATTGACSQCGHWPYAGRHPGEHGCMATGGTLRPCGCQHEGTPVPYNV